MKELAEQLDVLLEPERRAQARRRAIVIGAGVLAAGGLAASLSVAYAQRSAIALGVCQSSLGTVEGKLSEGTATLGECRTGLAIAVSDKKQCRDDLTKEVSLRESMAGTKTGCTAAENTSYSKLIVDCRKERDGIRAERDALGVKLDETGKDRDGLRAKLDATSRDRDDLRAKLSASDRDRDDLRGKLDAAGKDRDALRAKLDAAGKDKDALAAKLAAAEKDREGMAAKLDAAGKDRDAARADKQRCDGELSACRATPHGGGVLISPTAPAPHAGAPTGH